VNVRHVVELTDEERMELIELTSKGKQSARKVRRAHILLMLDAQTHTREHVAEVLSSSTSTVYRTARRFVEGGLLHAINEDDRPGGMRLLDARQEATLVAVACTNPPDGRAKWTLQLLADRLVVLTDLETVSAETVRRRLKENVLKPWQQRMWCIPKFNADYVANMEEVLDIYSQPRDPEIPLVCFDETMKQLVQETRAPIPAAPGRPMTVDYEYRRNGTANLFMFVAPLEGWRHVKITKHRGNVDFAECMRDLVDTHFPDADIIRVVMDNLNTHRQGALYAAFSPQEARRILRRLEFHFTPKHGSWLNMAEIEIGILSRQCLDRRIGDVGELEKQVSTWEAARNEAGPTIDWRFGLERARAKLTRAYAAAAKEADGVASELKAA